MLKNIEYLENYLNTYPYMNDIQIAKFFVRNRCRIKDLLPGIESKNFDMSQNKFLATNKLCNDIINPKLILQYD